MDIRPQYHFRQVERSAGLTLDAWWVPRLIELSRTLPIIERDPNSFSELHGNHWYMESGAVPSPMSVLEHMRLILECDLSYPIILDAQGRVMDGMHRICRAVFEQRPSIAAVQFVSDPEPDFCDCHPANLPYDRI